MTARISPALIAYGTRAPSAILADDEGAIPLTWRLRNYEGATCEVQNDGQHVEQLHNMLRKGWFDNDEMTEATNTPEPENAGSGAGSSVGFVK